MNEAIEQLRGLLHIHGRGAGHTVAAVKIATEIKGLLVVAEPHQSRCEPIASAIRHQNLKVATLAEVAWPRAAGLNCPIVVDHFALETLLGGIDEAVRELESKLRTAQTDLRVTKDKLLTTETNLRIAESKLREAKPQKPKKSSTNK